MALHLQERIITMILIPRWMLCMHTCIFVHEAPPQPSIGGKCSNKRSTYGVWSLAISEVACVNIDTYGLPKNCVCVCVCTDHVQSISVARWLQALGWNSAAGYFSRQKNALALVRAPIFLRAIWCERCARRASIVKTSYQIRLHPRH